MALARLSVGVGKKGKAAPHAQYIAREGKYTKPISHLEKLEFTGQGNMPKWAEKDPNFFWQMSDEYERSNGSAYREHVIALPRELTPEQRHDLVRDWIEKEIGEKHAYQYAIHNPPALDGEEQPHCHLMFSERTIDGIVRDPEQYFKRYNAKSPNNGGAKKANTGMKPAQRKVDLKAQRDRWEQTCNTHLERAGSKQRINMKSYKDRGSSYKPLDLSMKQIKQPEIKQAYIEHLHAKKEFFAARRNERSIDIPQEISYQKKRAEQERIQAQAEQERIQAEKKYTRQELLPLSEMSFLSIYRMETLEKLHQYHEYITKHFDDDKQIDSDFFDVCKGLNHSLETFNEQLEKDVRYTYYHDELNNLEKAFNQSKVIFSNVFKELDQKGLKPRFLKPQQQKFADSHNKVLMVMNSSREQADRIALKGQATIEQEQPKSTYTIPRP